MGTQVLAAADSNTKPNYVVSTVAFGSVAIGDGELAVFVGANIVDQVEAYNGLTKKALQAIREAAWPNPASLSVTESIYDVIAKASTDTLSEDTVAIILGSGFTTVSGASSSAHVRRMAELWLESTAKAA